PINLATNVVSYNNIYIKFSEPISSGANYNNITVKNALGTAIAITKSISGNTLLIQPNNFLLDNGKYTVTIPSGSIKDNENLGLIGQKTFSFTTAVNTAPIVVNVSLPNIALSFGNNINVQFNEAIFSGTNYGNITVKNASGSVIPTTKWIIGNTLIIDPKGDLANNQKYTVTIPKAAVKDSKGMPLGSQYTASFTITT
ncbi:MAG TPA: Ig-like domain-containing protein, partial [Clostridium sp.]